MKRIISTLTALGLAAALCACGNTAADPPDVPFTTAALSGSTQPSTKQVPAGSADGISDESGEFTYNGALRVIGDDTNGYLLVPAGFVNYQDADTEGLVQASDTSGTNILTITHYPAIDYETLANSMRMRLESSSEAEGLTGAKAAPGGYDAYQIYCHYKDGFFYVAWAIQDPADEKTSYYMGIEFDSEHQYLLACSSTFRTPEDYHRENG